jgi:hypothetical protein
MKFKDFLKQLKEETTSGDIATVDTKLDMVKRSKKCKLHDEYDCEECKEKGS